MNPRLRTALAFLALASPFPLLVLRTPAVAQPPTDSWVSIDGAVFRRSESPNPDSPSAMLPDAERRLSGVDANSYRPAVPATAQSESAERTITLSGSGGTTKIRLVPSSVALQSARNAGGRFTGSRVLSPGETAVSSIQHTNDKENLHVFLDRVTGEVLEISFSPR